MILASKLRGSSIPYSTIEHERHGQNQHNHQLLKEVWMYFDARTKYLSGVAFEMYTKYIHNLEWIWKKSPITNIADHHLKHNLMNWFCQFLLM